LAGDAHSVGLAILRHALLSSGYDVHYLGPQSSLHEFMQHHYCCDVIFVSSLDGHARHYLTNFPKLHKGNSEIAINTMWYLGGNLGFSNKDDCVRYFKSMGFRQVFPSYVPIDVVLENLQIDLTGAEPLRPRLFTSARDRQQIPLFPQGSDDKIDEEQFMAVRRKVLEQWRTGNAASDLDANAAFLAGRPLFSDAQLSVQNSGQSILIQPRSGVALPRHQLEHFITFKRSGVKALSFQIDSLTRNNDYAAVEAILRDLASTAHAPETHRTVLNGYPMINHGVAPLRRIVAKIGLPLQTRHSTRDPRLLAEISFAGGVTSYEGGAISYNIPYYRNYSLSESVAVWQYVDRLVGLYHERYGIVLDREFFGTLTGTLIPPSLAIVTNLLECLLAVKQGVRSISLGYAEQGNRTQDIAACRTLKQMANELLYNLGYRDIRVTVVFHQYMGAFPQDRLRAANLIRASATTAALSGAARVLTKTPAEAFRIPTVTDNLEGLALFRQGVAAAQYVQINEPRIEEECDVIRAEVQSIIDAVLYSGGGIVTVGIAAAFAKGLIDIPFAPSIYNRGEVLTVRDAHGAVRFSSFGRLPFSREIRQFNLGMISTRKTGEGANTIAMVERDVLQIPRGQYAQWPLDYEEWNA
jgi:methylaspartate mutase epsilon subunit